MPLINPVYETLIPGPDPWRTAISIYSLCFVLNLFRKTLEEKERKVVMVKLPEVTAAITTITSVDLVFLFWCKLGQPGHQKNNHTQLSHKVTE